VLFWSLGERHAQPFHLFRGSTRLSTAPKVQPRGSRAQTSRVTPQIEARTQARWLGTAPPRSAVYELSACTVTLSFSAVPILPRFTLWWEWRRTCPGILTIGRRGRGINEHEAFGGGGLDSRMRGGHLTIMNKEWPRLPVSPRKQLKEVQKTRRLEKYPEVLAALQTRKHPLEDSSGLTAVQVPELVWLGSC
jgi:hypothetical protein